MLGNAVVVPGFLFSIPAFSQTQTMPPTFEVADVKIDESREARMAVDFLPGGKLSMRNVPMKVVIAMASLMPGRISPDEAGCRL